MSAGKLSYFMIFSVFFFVGGGTDKLVKKASFGLKIGHFHTGHGFV